MSQPLGKYAGLSCEISECIDALNNQGAKDLMEIVFKLGGIALTMANQKNPKEKMNEVINNGSAFEIFNKMVYEHGGNLKKIKKNYLNITEIKSTKNGYLEYINTKKIGNAVNFLTILNGKRDDNAGIQFFKKNDDFINKGDVVFQLFGSNLDNIEIAKKIVDNSFIIK